MKSNLRNEIKSYIIRQGMTMQEVVDLLRDEHGWSDSVSNLSNKLQRESLRYVEACLLYTSDPNSNEFAPFLNIMNEWYLRDLSRKQKTAIRVKGESGKPTTNCAIYGYKKDPENKYHWLIDEEAAAVVRRIFQLTIEGLSLIHI